MGEPVVFFCENRTIFNNKANLHMDKLGVFPSSLPSWSSPGFDNVISSNTKVPRANKISIDHAVLLTDFVFVRIL